MNINNNFSPMDLSADVSREQVLEFLKLPPTISDVLFDRILVQRIQTAITPAQADFYIQLYKKMFEDDEEEEEEEEEEEMDANDMDEDDAEQEQEDADLEKEDADLEKEREDADLEKEKEDADLEKEEAEFEYAEQNDFIESKVLDETYNEYLQSYVYSRKNPTPFVDSNKNPLVFQPNKSNTIRDYYESKTKNEKPIILRANNPILRETVTYQLCIYSNSRVLNDESATSTQFVIQLTDPLRDVLKLSLYGISIPDTWYTISSVHGANYMLLQGISDGLLNGVHDVMIEISPGNYTASKLVTAVQDAFEQRQLTTGRPAFGTQSQFTYNPVTYKTTFQLDVDITYKDVDYIFSFEDWESPFKPTPVDESSGVAMEEPATYISEYMGMLDKSYSMAQIRSQYGVPSLLEAESIQYSIYTVNQNNSTFEVIAFVGPDEYNRNTSTILTTKEVTLSLPTGRYSRSRIAEAVQFALQTHPAFLPTSTLDASATYATSTSTPNSYYYIQIDWRPEYYQRAYRDIPFVKTVIQFPNESTLVNNNKIPIWADYEKTVDGIQSTVSSCFQFNPMPYGIIENGPPPAYELGLILSDAPLATEQIDLSGTFIGFHCTTMASADWQTFFTSTVNHADISGTDISGVDISGNDFRIFIEEDSYSYDSFIDHVQTRIENMPFFTQATNINLVGNSLELWVDIVNNIDPVPFLVSIAEEDALYNISDATNPYDPLLFSVQTPYRITIEPGFYPLSGQICTIQVPTQYQTTYVDEQGMPAKRNTWLIADTNNTAISYNLPAFANRLQQIFQQFLHPDIPDVYPLRNTIVSYSNETKSFQIEFQISFSLNENDYAILLPESITRLFDLSGVDLSFQDISGQTYFSYPIISESSETGLESYAILASTAPPIPGTGFVWDTLGKSLIRMHPSVSAIQDGLQSEFVAVLPEKEDPYFATEMVQFLNESFQTNMQQDSHYMDWNPFLSIKTINGSRYIQIRPFIQYSYSAKDYKLTLFDESMLVDPGTATVVGSTITSDFTLGWMLGFRTSIEYELIDTWNEEDQSSTLTGDATVLSNAYNNLYIVLDDYTNSRLSDGIHITHPYDNVEQLPKAQTICTVSTDDSYLNVPLKQLYSNISKKVAIRPNTTTRIPTYSQDAFAVLPVKRASDGQNFIDTGGTLGLQNRNFIGPVTIRKLGVRLIDERGINLDLNGGEWSFIVTVERLYKRENTELIH